MPQKRAQNIHHITGPCGTRSSYKKINTPSGRSTLNDDATSKVARPRSDSGASDGLCSRTMLFSVSKRKTQRLPATDTLLPRISAIPPSNSQLQRRSVTTNFITAEEVFQCFILRNRFSRGEMSFIQTASLLGIEEAIRQASGFGLSYKKPLGYLRSLIRKRRDSVPNSAIAVTAISQQTTQQPSPVSREATNERDRNYSARSAKRKPLSGSPTSSRKRSSSG